MELNFLGLVAALAAFLSIWWGHVAVRKIEAVSVKLWQPMVVVFVLGTVFTGIALRTESRHLSAAFGIAGMVFFWDTFELYRQEKRAKRGHAPANPNNPRHSKILKHYPDATTLDWLDRNPRGKQYSVEELAKIKATEK